LDHGEIDLHLVRLCWSCNDGTKGSLLIEIILWLCLLIPGLIYSIWRMTTKYKACPACKQATLIPADSPMGGGSLRRIFPMPRPLRARELLRLRLAKH